MNKEKAMEKLLKQKSVAEGLTKIPSGSQEFKKWYRDTEVAIENIFGEGTRHSKDFDDISYSLSFFSTSTSDYEFEVAYQSGVKTAVTLLQSFIDEIEEYWNSDSSRQKQDESANSKVEHIIRKFHQIARQLRSRYADRPTVEIEDEYDVQDLFHALLRMHFDDIRPEECTPSYAGSSSRVDFLLKKERIVVEIKKTRKGLGAKDVGEQLIIDSHRYQSHPDCDYLICFVYDPDGRVANPRGIERDLSKEINGVKISVFITPNQ